MNQLHYLTFFVYMMANLTVAYYSLPAYKTFNKLAFLFWCCSSLLFVFITIYTWMIGYQHMSESHYFIYYIFRQSAYITATILGAAGTVLFIREYRRPFAEPPVIPPPAALDGSFMTIRTFTNQIQAGITATFLQDKDIAVVLLDQNSCSYIGAPNAAPIRLQVPDLQAEEATQWLAEFDATPALPPEEKTGL